MVCYGRGAVPISGLWLNVGSVTAFDPVSLAKTFYVYGMVRLRIITKWKREHWIVQRRFSRAYVSWPCR